MKTTVLSLTNTVTPALSKSNVFHVFRLDKTYEELEIRFAYLPKKHPNRGKSLKLIRQAMERYAPSPFDKAYGQPEDYLPILNLLTLSLDDPEGYRGCAHRHDETQVHYINQAYASPGLYQGQLPRGEWRIAVNLHCVVTDSCTYMLEVLAGEEKTV